MDDVIEGWKGIAAALRVTEGPARERAALPVDPLPVKYDHAGHVFIGRSVLDDWMRRHEVGFSDRRARRRGRRSDAAPPS